MERNTDLNIKLEPRTTIAADPTGEKLSNGCILQDQKRLSKSPVNAIGDNLIHKERTTLTSSNKSLSSKAESQTNSSRIDTLDRSNSDGDKCDDNPARTSVQKFRDVTFPLNRVNQSGATINLTSNCGNIASLTESCGIVSASCTSRNVKSTNQINLAEESTIVTNSDMATKNGESSTSTGNIGSEESSDNSSKDKDSLSPSTTSKKDKCNLRKGKWTPEEEEYTQRIIHYFRNGMLRLPEGTTLRGYLAEKLNCDPMRITKKFAGASCLGKRVYHFGDRCQVSPQEVSTVKNELAQLEGRFHLREQQGNASIPIHALVHLGTQPPPSSTVNDVISAQGISDSAPAFLSSPQIVNSVMPSLGPSLQAQSQVPSQTQSAMQSQQAIQQQMAIYFQSYMAAAMQSAAFANGGQLTPTLNGGFLFPMDSSANYPTSKSQQSPNSWPFASNVTPIQGFGMENPSFFGQASETSSGFQKQPTSTSSDAMGINAALKWAQIAKLTSALSQIAQANAASYLQNEHMRGPQTHQTIYPTPALLPNMAPVAYQHQFQAAHAPLSFATSAGTVQLDEKSTSLQQSVPSNVALEGQQDKSLPMEDTNSDASKRSSISDSKMIRSKEEQDAAQALSGIVTTLNTLRENHARAVEEAKLRKDESKKEPKRPDDPENNHAIKRQKTYQILTTNGNLSEGSQSGGAMSSKSNTKSSSNEPSGKSIVQFTRTGKTPENSDRKNNKFSTKKKSPTVVSSNPSDTSGDSENSSLSSKRKSFHDVSVTKRPLSKAALGKPCDSGDSLSSSDNFRSSSQGMTSTNEGSEENSKTDPSLEFSEDANGSDESDKDGALSLVSNKIATLETNPVKLDSKNKRRKKSKIGDLTSQNVADHTTRMDAMQANGHRGVW